MAIGRWFNLAGKSSSYWAWMFHRLTGMVLLVYLCMHLLYLTSLTDKTGHTYESYISTTVTPSFLVFDVLLVLCGIYHGINGLRLIIHELGFAHGQRKALLTLSIVITIVLWLYASYTMYSLVGG